MSDDLVERLNVVLATLERGDILMIAQEDDCRWIHDAKAEIERLRAAAPLYQEALQRADLLIRTLPRKWWRAPNVGVKAVAAIKELIDLAGRRRGCYGRN